MAAETGSGKTGAFCLPILQITWEALKALESGKRQGSGGGASASGKSDGILLDHLQICHINNILLTLDFTLKSFDLF